jgi:tRNA(Ile)-lysidine synthase
MMLDRVRETIRRHNMLSQGDRVIVAVSGGPDSVALLHILHRLAGEWNLALHVFHMDHGLRGEASRADARYVAELAERLGHPCTVVTLAPGELKRRPGSLQANARAARYEALAALVRQVGARCVALGHHRDDQAETVLMRFLRGAGPHGLAGIPPVRQADGVTYIRPLIDVRRSEIETYCTAHELFPRQDESNLRAVYLRNRLRLELVPYLERTYNPALVENLAQLADILREEDRFLEEVAQQALEQCRVPDEGVALRGDLLLCRPPAVARRVIRLAARLAAGPNCELGLVHVTQVLGLLHHPHGSHRLDLPGVRVTVEYGVCRFEQPEDHGAPAAARLLTVPGITEMPDLNLRIEAVYQAPTGAAPAEVPAPATAAPAPRADPEASCVREAAFDADRLPGPLAVRFRLPGDRIWPVGMAGSKKLQDLLVDAKVPRRLRDRIPLLVAGPDLLWVIGYRLDRRYLATPATEKVLVLRVYPLRPKGPAD